MLDFKDGAQLRDERDFISTAEAMREHNRKMLDVMLIPPNMLETDSMNGPGFIERYPTGVRETFGLGGRRRA